MTGTEVPRAGTGRAYPLARGATITVINTTGTQVVDGHAPADVEIRVDAVG